MQCGIDFGTSNSAIAVAGGKAATLAPVEADHLTLPSALFYPPGRPPVYGRAAIHGFSSGDEGRFMRSLKRMLGTQMMNYGTIINDKPRRFDEIIGGFVSYMKAKGETACGKPLDSVVMGRPVHFVDGDTGADYAAEEQLRRIAGHAGFRYIEFQFEPIAAAFAHETKLTSEKLAMVVDIGGGTSDFTVIRLGPALAQKTERKDDILGNAGVRVGGNDLDKDLSLSAFMPPLGYQTAYGDKNLTLPLSWFHDLSEWSKANFLYTPKFRTEIKDVYRQSCSPREFGRFVKVVNQERGHRLLSVIEQAKIDLTDREEATAALEFIEEGFSVATHRRDFERAVAGRLDKIAEAVSECLALSQVQQNQIELVVLTGGPTETPVIRRLIKEKFPTAAISEENKLSSVALGLGYDSRRRFGS